MPLPRKIQGLRAFLPDKDAHVLVPEACLTQGLQGWIELVVGVEKACDRASPVFVLLSHMSMVGGNWGIGAQPFND